MNVQVMFRDVIVSNDWGTIAGVRVFFVRPVRRKDEGYDVIKHLPVCCHAPQCERHRKKSCGMKQRKPVV